MVAHLKSQQLDAISSGGLCGVEIAVDQRVNHEFIRKLEVQRKKGWLTWRLHPSSQRPANRSRRRRCRHCHGALSYPG